MGRLPAGDNTDFKYLSIRHLAEKWDLQAVYDLMSRELGSSSGTVGEVCRYLLSSPGKGIRPLLVLISSGISRLDKQSRIRLAAALETLHLATLAHDDVLDKSMMRRGVPSINSRWDNNTAILTGDFLFGKSLEMVQGLGEEVNRRFAGIIIEVVTGEFQQAETIFDSSLSIEAYKERISKKTASLISNCCAMAAVASGSFSGMVPYLERFGFYTGMAFQIQDDILDWCEGERHLGKPVTHDLQQGVLTLPVLLALQLSRNRGKIVQIVASQRISQEDLSFIKEELVRTGALKLAGRTVFFYGRQAVKCLDFLPEANERNDLEALVRNILSKTSQKNL